MKRAALFLTVALLVVSACGTPASSTATSSATASPVPSPSVMPADFVLPQGCSYVGKGVVDPAINTLMSWEINCGAAPDMQAIEKFTPVFAQQGWTLCSPPMGKGFWAKGNVQSMVTQSAAGYPVLSQLPRQTQDCPLLTAYVNSSYKFSLELPAPYRNSARLSLANTGGRPAGQDAFTARTDADEATVSGTRCETACPIWNYVAVIQIYTEVASQTPRQFYTAFGGAVGEVIEDTTIDGRQAVKVTNGVPYRSPQYLVKDGDRMFRIAMQYYAPSPDMAVPVGASTSKLEQILTSFRFTP